jgi:hypothetical protein
MSTPVWSVDARTGEHVARAALAAAGIAGRGTLLREMAAGLESAADELAEVADAESALGEPRVDGRLEP